MFLLCTFAGRERVLTVPDDCDLALLKQIAANEYNIPSNEIQIDYAGMIIQEGAVQPQGIVEGSQLTIQRRKMHLRDIPQSVLFNSSQMIKLGEEHPHLLEQMEHEWGPEWPRLIRAKDEPGLRLHVMKLTMRGFKVDYEKKREFARLYENPDDPENQKRIAELIQKEQIEAAHDLAMQENPEAFAPVTMLYVNVSVNNHPLKAFVDSGAQMTIMSRDCAERCGLLRLMDKRYSGIASGVGQGKILGKVLNAVMKMGNSFFPISVTVLESNSMECLFGLDTLRRYRCTIDLERNVLRLLDGATPEETPFLSEHEIPIREREVVLDPMDIAVTDPTTQTSAPAVGAGPDTSALSSSSSSSALPVIEQLMQLTASTREAVEGALLQAEGNADLAATLLFAAK